MISVFFFYINWGNQVGNSKKVSFYNQLLTGGFILNLKGLIGLCNIFSALSSSFIQYCDSNIGLFSIASYKVIALPTIATAIVFALTRS